MGLAPELLEVGPLLAERGFRVMAIAAPERVDSGHDVVEDAPEATARLVAEWLG